MPAGTQPAVTATSGTPPRVTRGGAWCLSASVALRPEPFGALAYDFSTRQLSFLKTPALVRVVRGLEHGCVDDALVAAGVAEPDRPAYLAALGTLARTGIIKERAA